VGVEWVHTMDELFVHMFEKQDCLFRLGYYNIKMAPSLDDCKVCL